ncbi:hypothetical protein SBRCBS47491_001553 [Sporothrix bragantina]|uniref:HpcH/HpaI aldolase/citrate lyase domain-containing protein n=1 Tax=Sporothrix bragantina TaxID=671064 RepID=A0ABP0AZL6_9PEZI
MTPEEDLAIARNAIFSNTFKTTLDAGKIATSVMARAVTNHTIGQVAANAGFHAVMVDMEHSVVGLETAAGVFASTLSAGLTPLVRVPPDSGAEWISRSLDGGALGVIVPHVNTAAEARAAVKYAKFSPLGERSISGGLPIFGLKNVPQVAASQVANENTLVICMIETQKAVDNVDEILAVEGVDMLHVGTNDLADSLGITGDLANERIFAMYTRISDAAARASAKNKNGRKIYIGMGGLQGRPEVIHRLVNEDKNKLIRWISTADFPMYAQALEDCATMMNKMLN